MPPAWFLLVVAIIAAVGLRGARRRLYLAALAAAVVAGLFIGTVQTLIGV
jgi:hypothetical protein